MELLLIHQNFPGQFRELGPAWLELGHRVTAIGSKPEHPQGERWKNLNYWCYNIECEPPDKTTSLIKRGSAVSHLCKHLVSKGFQPDIILAHSAWGEALYLRTVFPKTPLVIYPELWGTPEALGVGFDECLTPGSADYSMTPADLTDLLLELERQNLVADLAISQSDSAVVPSTNQINSFPSRLRPMLTLIPEGVDVQRILPSSADVCLPSLPLLHRGDPIVTLVSRELEPLRGLRQTLRAWPMISRSCPNAQLVLVGGQDCGYGREQPESGSHLADALTALGPEVDRSRIHCPGRLDYPEMLHLLQCSTCHLALSYPYTLSWSTLEAMACGAPIVTNEGSPLSVELVHGETGMIINFSSELELSNAVTRILQDQPTRTALATAGRKLIEQRFSLTLAVDRYEQLFQNLHRTHTGQEP